MTMLMAGLTHGMLQKAGVPTNASTISGLGKHAANQTVHAGVKAGVDLTLTGKVDLKSTTLAVAANTASAFIANHIGQWYKGSDGNAVAAIAHKALHGLNAAGRSFLVGGEKGMAASAIGAVVAESIAETFQPTGGIDKLPASERPTYDPDETRKIHAAAQLAAGGIAYAIGMDANAINEAAFSAMHALTHNHGYTLTAAGYLGAEGTEPEEEKKQDEIDTPALTIGGTEFDVIDHQENSVGLRKRSLSLTSLYLYDKKITAEGEWNSATDPMDRYHAMDRVGGLEKALDRRSSYKTAEGVATNTARFINDHPLQAAWFAGESAPVISVPMTLTRNAKELWCGEQTLGFAALDVGLSFAGGIIKGAKATVNAFRAGKAGVNANSIRLAREALDLAQSKAFLNNGDFFHKHHIISNKHKETAKHPLWDAAGIDPNDSRNMMRLPTLEGSKIGTNTRSIHEGKHVGKINKDLAGKMDDVLDIGRTQSWTQPQYQQELIKIINEEKAVLRSGERALNKHARPRTEHVDANS